MVDESGRYVQGGDMSILSPPEPTAEDRNAAVDLSKQPVEKLFRLLAYELMREEKRPPERRLGVREFQVATDMDCAERLIHVTDKASEVLESVRLYHLNITGTSGLFWLLHKYPEEHSWVWLISISHSRILRKVGHHFAHLAALALDDPAGCFSPDFRTVLMSAANVWKKISSDQVALLWNGIAFGILGDVTAWREMDEEGNTEDAPGGPPPNVSWSENIIFGNMWMSSVVRWLEHHQQEIAQAAYGELSSLQAGVRKDASGFVVGEGSVLSSFEYLRRQLFGGWSLDKGLLRGLLRHLLRPSYGDDSRPSVADFGAGGGRYSQWLNETGLVDAYAFDATHVVEEITGGSVQQTDLAINVRMWRTFEWVLCLEVGAYMTAVQARSLLRNARAHASLGLVMSWGSDPHGAGSASPLPESDFMDLVVKETGFSVDRGLTEKLRSACELDALARTVVVFVAPA